MLARTWRRPSLSRLRSSAPAASSSSWSPGGLGQLDELEPELEHGRRQLGEPRCERDADAVGVGARLAQRERAPPGAAADEPCGERDLADEAVAPLGPCERASRRSRRARGAASARSRSPRGTRATPRAPPAGGGRARARPSRLSPGSRRAGRPAPIVRRRRHPGARQAVRAFARRVLRARRSAAARAAASVSGSGARNCRTSSSRTTSSCPGLATDAAASAAKRRPAAPMRASQRVPTAASARLQRRLEAAVEPLDAARLEVGDAEPCRLDREARVLERADDLLPGLLGRGRIGLDEHELRARRERLAEPHPRPDARGLGRRRHGAEQRLPAGLRRERRRAQGEGRRARSAAFSSNPGMDEAGDHGNVCSTRTHVLLSSSAVTSPSPSPLGLSNDLALETHRSAQVARASSCCGRRGGCIARGTPPTRRARPPARRTSRAARPTAGRRPRTPRGTPRRRRAPVREEAPVLEHVERLPEPRGAAATAAAAGICAHSLKSASSRRGSPAIRLVRDAAEARERIGRRARGSRTPSPARPACRRRPSPPRRCSRRAARRRARGRGASRSRDVQDHRPGRLLDPVAVPARERVLRVLRAQPPRRADGVERRRRVVGAAQRDPVVVECALRAVGRVARRRAACTRAPRGRSSRGSRA